MEKKTVLFLCIHNSARSQMAEAFLNHSGSDKFKGYSAGLEAGTINPFAVEVMLEEGIDISGNQSKDVIQFIESKKSFDFVITVCDAKNSERCPVFPGKTKKEGWEFDDPSAVTGTNMERLTVTRRVRDEIKRAVSDFIKRNSL
jgi:arsenate reductase (thioredoxin)